MLGFFLLLFNKTSVNIFIIKEILFFISKNFVMEKKFYTYDSLKEGFYGRKKMDPRAVRTNEKFGYT